MSTVTQDTLNNDTKMLIETDAETFFSDTKFSETETETFFQYQIFQNRHQNPQKIGKSFESEKFRNQNVNLWQDNGLG